MVLRYIDNVARVGVFKDASGARFPLERISLVYAGNGHGKSTLAAILSAAGDADTDSIKERQSLGTQSSALIKLRSVDGTELVHANATWHGPNLNTWVFDSEFVDRNVHTGGSVQPSHRAGLLAFAIGDKAVEQEAALENAQNSLAAAKESLGQHEAQIIAFAHALDSRCTIDDFENLAIPVDPDAAVAAADARVVTAQNAASIYAQPVPVEIDVQKLLTPDFFDSLAQTLDGVHQRARTMVTSHIESFPTGDISPEHWLAEGLHLAADNSCPYCGQATSGVELVDMYAHFFNEAYGRLRAKIDRYESALGKSARVALLASVQAAYNQASTTIASWRSLLELPNLPELGHLTVGLSAFGAQTDELLTAKRERLELQVGSSDIRDKLLQLETEIWEPIDDVNRSIREIVHHIETFKSSLSTANIPEIKETQLRARLAVTRASDEVVNLFGARADLEQKVQEAEQSSKAARLALKEAMEATLGRFESSINRHLRNLGAKFSIDKVAPSFAGGGGGRSNYGLRLKGHSIDISKGVPPFRLALSEGDKRTLAFAFFCVTVLSKQDLRGEIVVVDDPVTSLDRSRRRHTTDVLNEMSLAGAQVIVLAHDATYLREVRAKASKNPLDNHGSPRAVTEMQISQDALGDSTLASVDLDVECESEYFRNYRRIRCFLDGEDFDGHSVLHNDAGSSIRPLIESYLHRRFPGRIPADKKTLGSIIGLIDRAEPGSVLAHARPLATELRDLNDFGTRYHHDASSDIAEPKPDATEVRAYAERAFNMVHGAPMSL